MATTTDTRARAEPRWSRGRPPRGRWATEDDWRTAPGYLSVSWAAWLVGLSDGALRDILRDDQRLADRMTYQVRGRQLWVFKSQLRRWVEGRLDEEG